MGTASVTLMGFQASLSLGWGGVGWGAALHACFLQPSTEAMQP